MSPRWLHWPSSGVVSSVIGTCTGWSASTGNRTSVGWSAGPIGTGSASMDLRTDSNGGWIYFPDGADASAFLAAYGPSGSQSDIVVTHSGGVYTWDHTAIAMDIISTNYVRMRLAGWSGTIPTVSDAATITIA